MSCLLALAVLAGEPLPAQDKTATPAKKEEAKETGGDAAGTDKPKLVYVLEIDDPIMEPMLYYFRRGIKEAADAKADMLVINMDTPGGSVATMEEIMDLIAKFKPQDQTYTYVNPDALSAGALIACSTRHIYFAPLGRMGAAAAVMSGGGEIEDTMKLKINSASRAQIREVARVNGHRPGVFEAMIDENFELKIGDEVLKPKGELLTLTASEALKEYGKPPAPLLSAGTVDSLEELIKKIAGPDAKVVEVKPTGYEDAATYITLLAPLLFSIGIVLAYMDMQSPGFGFFGVTAVLAFGLVFFGHYIAGLSNMDESLIALLIFGVGVMLVLVEFLIFPGTILAGMTGAGLMLGSLIWVMIDRFPGEGALPSLDALETPLYNVSLGILLSVMGIIFLLAFVPRVVRNTEFDGADTIGSGRGVEAPKGADRLKVGDVGECLTSLHPSGEADFGGQRLDVVSDGRMVAKGAKVEVISIDGLRILVKPAEAPEEAAS